MFINGTSHAYEIKTAFDSLDRLEGQLSDYRRCFDNVSVVSSNRHISKLLKELDDIVGLHVLTQSGSIRTIRKPLPNAHNVEAAVIFDTLRKNEYVPMISQLVGSSLDIPNGVQYRYCKEVFCQLTPIQAHGLMVEALKKRRKHSAFVSLLTRVPKSLKAAALSLRMSMFQVERLLHILHSPADSLAE